MKVVDQAILDYSEIARSLKAGGVIIYPTDTAYAVGCDATNEEAVEKIFKIKGRDKAKTLSLIAADVAMAEDWLDFSERARSLAREYWPGPLTLVLPVKKPGLASAAIADGAAAMRVPDNAIAKTISQNLGLPLVATSANRSGQGPDYNIRDVMASVGEAALPMIECVVDGGQLKVNGVSTLVKVCDNKVEVIREGIIKIK